MLPSKPSIKSQLRRERRYFWALILLANFAVWIFAGLYVTDCGSVETTHDLSKGYYVNAVVSVGWGNLLAAALIVSLAAQLWLPRYSSKRQRTSQRTTDSIKTLISTTSRWFAHRHPHTPDISAFVHLLVDDYLLPLCTASSSEHYMSDERTVISISQAANAESPFVIAEAVNKRCVVVRDIAGAQNLTELEYNVQPYRAIIGSPIYDRSDPTRIIGTLSFGSNQPEDITRFTDVEDTVNRIAEVISHLWSLVEPRDPIVNDLQSMLKDAARRSPRRLRRRAGRGSDGPPVPRAEGT